MTFLEKKVSNVWAGSAVGIQAGGVGPKHPSLGFEMFRRMTFVGSSLIASQRSRVHLTRCRRNILRRPSMYTAADSYREVQCIIPTTLKVGCGLLPSTVGNSSNIVEIESWLGFLPSSARNTSTIAETKVRNKQWISIFYLNKTYHPLHGAIKCVHSNLAPQSRVNPPLSRDQKIFHNLTGFDSHLILKHAQKRLKKDTTPCIGTSSEKLITFTYHGLKFLVIKTILIINKQVYKRGYIHA